jgi:D-3-phosphoglycerate dehydrogenase / 2-oxoglutarate reductase
MTARILVAGDYFVTNRLLRNALATNATQDLEITELMLPWPIVPFGPVAEVIEASGTEDELIAALKDVEICVTHKAPLTEKVLAASPHLKLFSVARGGPVNANLSAATRHGVRVSFAPGRNATATAEHTVAMILAAIRRIPFTHADLVGGTWRGDYYTFDKVGPELEGSTVGLVGYGAIGSRVARIMNGFGAHVLVHDPYVDPAAVAAGAEVVSLDELLKRSLVVSIHARATAETNGMIGAKQLALMPVGSVVVNCARGSLIDYEAICDALDSGHLFAAAFDVFPQEPIPPTSRLLRTPNIVMTPHLAGSSRETAMNAARIVAEDVGRYLRGEQLAHCANP